MKIKIPDTRPEVQYIQIEGPAKDKYKPTPEELRSSSLKLFSLGINIVPIWDGGSRNQTLIPLEELETRRQTKEEIDAYDWKSCSGIGVITGVNGFVTITIEKMDHSLIQDLFKRLELPSEYSWTVFMSNRTGIHILLKTQRSSLERIIQDTITWRCKDSHRSFEKLELRLKHSSTIVPPSIDENGNRYDWRFTPGFPDGPPYEKPLQMILDAIDGIGIRDIASQEELDSHSVLISNGVQSTRKSGRYDASEMTFKAFSEEYLKHVKADLAPKTFENSERVIKLANASFGGLQLSELRRDHIRKYADQRRKEVSPATADIDIRTLKAALEYAVECEYMRENPFRKFKSPRVEKKSVKYLTEAEFAKVMKEVKEPYLKDFFICAVLSMMRREEMIFLKWDDIDFERKLVLIHPDAEHRTKFNKERKIPLSQNLEKHFRSMSKASPFVFVNRADERLSADFVTKKFKAYCRKAGLDESVHFHCLRKTGATWAVANGAQPIELRDILGHSSVRTTEIYLGVPASSQRNAMEKINLPVEEAEKPHD